MLMDRALAKRLEAADAAASAACAVALRERFGATEVEILRVGGGVAVFAGARSPLTEVRGLGFDGGVAEKDLEDIESFLRKRGAGVHLEYCPLADAGLLPMLVKRGYRLSEHSNTLVRELDASIDSWASSDGVEIETIDQGRLDLWAETMCRGFFGEGEIDPAILASCTSTFYLDGCRCFLAKVDGVIAGAGTMAAFDGLGALFGQSTLEAFRGRGVQAAIIGESLRISRGAGCDLAMMCTLPGSGSQRNAERAGFRVAYTRSKLVREWD